MSHFDYPSFSFCLVLFQHHFSYVSNTTRKNLQYKKRFFNIGFLTLKIVSHGIKRMLIKKTTGLFFSLDQ